MAWEARKRGGRYYTRSRRVAGRVVRDYVGFGERGERAYWHDRRKHAAKALARDALERAQERCQAADMALVSYCGDIERHLRATLAGAGYHQHKRGEWRRRRGSSGSSGGSGGTGH
jgi:hypothetical protein